jgi:hypothetical protein
MSRLNVKTVNFQNVSIVFTVEWFMLQTWDVPSTLKWESLSKTITTVEQHNAHLKKYEFQLAKKYTVKNLTKLMNIELPHKKNH